MLEREFVPESGLVCCPLGPLTPEQGQIVECLLRLEGVLPGRRLAAAVELMDGGTCVGTRMCTVPAQQGGDRVDLVITGLRFYLPEGAQGPLTLRADAHYVDRQECCLLPE